MKVRSKVHSFQRKRAVHVINGKDEMYNIRVDFDLCITINVAITSKTWLYYSFSLFCPVL